MQMAATEGCWHRTGPGGSPSRRAPRPCRRVGALERREIHHPDREVQREELRLALDRRVASVAARRLERHRRRRIRGAGGRARAKLESARENGRGAIR